MGGQVLEAGLFSTNQDLANLMFQKATLERGLSDDREVRRDSG